MFLCFCKHKFVVISQKETTDIQETWEGYKDYAVTLYVLQCEKCGTLKTHKSSIWS